MWKSRNGNTQGLAGFFRIGFNHESLESHYLTNFGLIQHHKYSLTELNEMIPWERQIYLELLTNWLKEQEQKAKEQQLQQRN